jgi:ribosomal protein L37AE/L43A
MAGLGGEGGRARLPQSRKSKPEETPPRRWIYLTCRECQRPFKRRTRKGLWTKCPHCGVVQEGPAGVEKLRDQLARAKEKAARRRERRADTGGTKVPNPPPSSPQPPGGLRRFLSGGWEGGDAL